MSAMPNADVTVVIPVYNSEKTLRQAIDSALCQTLAPKEIILVDDGSSDRSTEIALSYGDQVRLLSQPNAGCGPARNTAIKASSSEWVAFLDADDFWLPDKLEKQMQAVVSRPNAVLCHTSGLYLKPNGTETTPPKQLVSADLTPYEQLLPRNMLMVSAVMVKRSAGDQVSWFDESAFASEDWDLWLRLAALGEFVYLNEPLMRYRVGAGGLSGNTPRKYLRSCAIIEERVLPNLDQYLDHAPANKRSKIKAAFFKQLAHLHSQRGKLLACEGDLKEARLEQLKAMRVHPRGFVYYLRWLRTFAPSQWQTAMAKKPKSRRLKKHQL